jgi:hypothetical protein
MGIARKTPIEHQRTLFSLSATRSLSALVIWRRQHDPR